MCANCFSDYYTRNGIDIKVRELITLSILIISFGIWADKIPAQQAHLALFYAFNSILDFLIQLT